MSFLYRKSRSRYRICLFVLVAFVMQITLAAALTPVYADEASGVPDAVVTDAGETVQDGVYGNEADGDGVEDEDVDEGTNGDQEGSTEDNGAETEAPTDGEEGVEEDEDAEDVEKDVQDVLSQQMAVVPFSGSDESKPYGKLRDVDVVVKQGDVEVEDNSLDPEKDISITVTFRVPVVGDLEDISGEPLIPGLEPEDCVGYKETIEFKLAEGFRVQASDALTLQVEDRSEDLGTVTFSTKGTGWDAIATATIEFDGDDAEDVLEGGDWAEVFGWFEATLSLDDEAVGEPSEEHKVVVLTKTFTIEYPPEEIVLKGKKTGEVNLENKRIDWTVVVAEGNNDVNLTDCEFRDDLNSVGEYVYDSFQVGKTESIDGAEGKSPTHEGEVLTYTFPEGSTGTQYIFFSTKFPTLFDNTKKTITINNKAEVTGQDQVRKVV